MSSIESILLVISIALALAGVLLFFYVVTFRFRYGGARNRPLGEPAWKRIYPYDEKNYLPEDRRLLLYAAILFFAGLAIIIFMFEKEHF